MILEPYPTRYFAIYEKCEPCRKRIRAYPFFGMLMGEDQDEDAIVYFDGDHEGCMREWGLTPFPEDPLGIRHCRVEDDPTVDERLARYTTLPGDGAIRPA